MNSVVSKTQLAAKRALIRKQIKPKKKKNKEKEKKEKIY